jgi:hypothetical protein
MPFRPHRLPSLPAQRVNTQQALEEEKMTGTMVKMWRRQIWILKWKKWSSKRTPVYFFLNFWLGKVSKNFVIEI